MGPAAIPGFPVACGSFQLLPGLGYVREENKGL